VGGAAVAVQDALLGQLVAYHSKPMRIDKFQQDVGEQIARINY